MNALLLDAAGQATSKKLAGLAKRSTPRKKLAADDDKDDDTLEKQETADLMNKEQAEQDAKDDAEAEEAIKQAIIKLEPLSD